MTPTAVILAAGRGTRLASVVPDRPKGLVEIGGEPLVVRSVRLLRQAGVRRIVVVVGHLAEAWVPVLGLEPDVELVYNPAFASLGSFESLLVGLEGVQGDVVVLEGDLLYEARALQPLCAAPGRNTCLVSDSTGAGDEVWVEARAGRLVAMSKDRASLGAVVGEQVGLHRLTPDATRALMRLGEESAGRRQQMPWGYECEGLVTLARDHPVEVAIVPGLIWGELDDPAHYRRLVHEVGPKLRELERDGPGPAQRPLVGSQGDRNAP